MNAAKSHDCPAVDALLDILDLREGWVAPQLREMSADEKLAIVYRHAEEALKRV